MEEVRGEWDPEEEVATTGKEGNAKRPTAWLQMVPIEEEMHVATWTTYAGQLQSKEK